MKGPLQPFCLIWFGCFPHVITSVFHSCNFHYRDKIVRYTSCDPWCSFYVKLHSRYRNSARESEAQAVVNRTSQYRSYNHELDVAWHSHWCQIALHLVYFLRHNLCSCCSHSCLELLPFHHSQNHLAFARIQITNYKALDHQNHQLKTHQAKRWKKSLLKLLLIC